MPDDSLQREFCKALGEGDCARVGDLVAAGADVNLPIGNLGGETPLIRAIAARDLDMVRLLIEAGADVNLPWKGPKSWTPLIFAHDNPEVLRELLSAGANVNARTTAHSIRSPSGRLMNRPAGETALHLAAGAGKVESVKVLLEAGAEVEARTQEGLAPLDYAVRLGNITPAAEALVEAGAQLTPQRLETMHSAGHSPDLDLLGFPFFNEPSASPAVDQAGGTQSEVEKSGQGIAPSAPDLASPTELRCPKCHALIYSRRSKLCGQCGAPLPPELILTDQQVQARDEARKWARELADKFSPRRSGQDRQTVPSTAQAQAEKIAAGVLSPQDLLHRVSCAEEFRQRQRPAFWLYAVGYGFNLFVIVFLFIHFTTLPPSVLLIAVGFFTLLCFRAWNRASPMCPNCHQNIRLCAAAFCHVCGQPLSHQRCQTCGVDNSWTSLLRPYANAGNFRWIAYCPGCGVYLGSKVPRWRAGRGG